MAIALVACDEAPATDSATGSETGTGATNDASTDSANGSTSSATDDANMIPADKVSNKVIAIDQIKERLVIYDFDNFEDGDILEDLEVWDTKITHAAGVKFREDTVFGDVIIVAGNRSQIIEYPSGKEIWGTNNPGNNSHSIEILPSGNIVIANSTGNSLRFFAASAILKGDTAGAQKYVDYELSGAHGVLWDPEYDVLWGLGNYDMNAYSIEGEGTDETLVLNPDMGTNFKGLVSGSGHDLQPDYTDTRYLYFTAGPVYRYDKEKNEVLTSFPYASAFKQPEVKGFSNNENDKFFATGELGGKGKFFASSSKESWLTDTIIFYYKEAKRGKVSMKSIQAVSEASAFYKVRSFTGTYQ